MTNLISNEEGETANLKLLKYFGIILIGLNFLALFGLETLPFQDLPQHLAYAKIFKEFKSNTLFQEYYQFVKQFNSYHLIYYVLKFFQIGLSTINSMKLLFFIYQLSLFFSIYHLKESTQNYKSPWISIILTAFLSWNAITMMGFLSYFLATPLILLSFSFLLRTSQEDDFSITVLQSFANIMKERSMILAITLLFLCSALHIFAAGSAFLLGSIFLFRQKRYKQFFVYSLFALFFVSVFSGGGNELGLHQIDIFRKSHYKNRFGLEFLNSIFDIKWNYLPSKLNYILWNFLGPFRLGELGILLISFSLLLFKFNSKLFINQKKIIQTFLLFTLVSFFLPWGIQIPTEITFINFRLLGIAALLFFILINEEVLLTKKSIGIIFCCFIGLKVIFLSKSFLFFNSKAQAFFNLLEHIPKKEKVLSIVYQNNTKHFAQVFRVQHFFPMYYTILRDGITSQFWARYTYHLPIAYRDEKKLPGAPDWEPRKAGPGHLQKYSHILVRIYGDQKNTSNYIQLKKEFDLNFTEIYKFDDWTYFKRKNDQTQIGPINKN